MSNAKPGQAPAPKETEVGYSITLGDSRFLIWGSAPTGKMPKALLTTPNGLLVSSNMGSAGARALSLFRTDPLRLDRHVELDGNAIELSLAPSGQELFITNSKRWGVLQVFDAHQLTLKDEISVPGFPKWMTVSPSGDKLFASLWTMDGISEVSLRSRQVRTHRPGKGRVSGKKSKNPRGSALSGDGTTLFVANNADRSLSLFDTVTLKERKRLDLGYAPRHIVANKAGSLLYISLSGEDSVVEFDVATESVSRRFKVGSRPKTIVLSEDGRFLYTANFVGQSLGVVDLVSEKQAELRLDTYKPSGLAVRADDRFIYLSGFCTNEVWAIERLSSNEGPSLPLGPDKDNHPCLDCYSTFAGCPYPRGFKPPKAAALVKSLGLP